MMLKEQEIIELLHKHNGNASAVDRELKEYRGYTRRNWIDKLDRVKDEYERINFERRLH